MFDEGLVNLALTVPYPHLQSTTDELWPVMISTRSTHLFVKVIAWLSASATFRRDKTTVTSVRAAIAP